MRVDRQKRYLAAWLNAKPIRQYGASCHEAAEDKASARVKALSDGVIGCGDIGERRLDFGGVRHLRVRELQVCLWSVPPCGHRTPMRSGSRAPKTAQERQ